MCKKVIILGWHFAESNIDNIDNSGKWDTIGESKGKLFQFSDESEFIIINGYKIYLLAYARGHFNKGDNDIVNGEIKRIIGKNNSKEILLLLHKPPWSDDNIINTRELYCNIFSGGKLYYDQDNTNGILNENENIFTKNISDLNWDFVWDEFYLLLEKKKRELIELWLPLAIDIQGLSEVSEEDFGGYLQEAKEDWKIDELIKSHNELIEEINVEKLKDFRVVSSSDYKELLKLNEIDSNQSDLLQSNSECFVPKFLMKLTSTFNEENPELT